MYAKIDAENNVVKWPYSRFDLKKDNPNVSFSVNIMSDSSTLSDYNVIEASSTELKKGWKYDTPILSNGSWSLPQVPKEIEELDPGDIIVVEQEERDGYSLAPGDPVFNGESWNTSFTYEKNDAEGARWYVSNRRHSYGDPYQQIEFITENGLEAWQAKVAEIKAKYPKP